MQNNKLFLKSARIAPSSSHSKQQKAFTDTSPTSIVTTYYAYAKKGIQTQMAQP
ncbi:MAG: hypothetical protein IKC85_00500 [Bacteroidaceae bacterium]|nr:hypothetical protein [Bacteroidaceae bacterium]